MQSQMIGMQSSLDRILSAIQAQQAISQQQMFNNGAGPSREGPGFMPPPRNGFNMGPPQPQTDPLKSFPPLPGFTPPVSQPAPFSVMIINTSVTSSLISTPPMGLCRVLRRPQMMIQKILCLGLL